MGDLELANSVPRAAVVIAGKRIVKLSFGRRKLYGSWTCYRAWAGDSEVRGLRESQQSAVWDEGVSAPRPIAVQAQDKPGPPCRPEVSPLRDRASPQAKARSRLEAKAASGLDSAHICTIHERRTDCGELFIAMSFYEGRALIDRICLSGRGQEGENTRRMQGPLPPAEAVEIAAQIARGLHSAHKRGIIRRDINPANIVVTIDATVNNLDFGLPKLAFDQEITQTLAGTTMGTVAYMPPKQVDGLQVDSRTRRPKIALFRV